jgi:mono/diheme cytochrome c family protein
METNSLLKKVNWLLTTSLIVLIATLGLGGTLFVSCEPAQSEEIARLDYTKEEMIARGKYLVNTSACHDCHSPKIMTVKGPEPDTTRLLSGHPSSSLMPKVNKEALKDWVLFGHDLTSAAGPWGVSFAANITSDETGVGNWTEEQFFTAIRKGKYKGLEGSRNLLPPMPWQVYNGMTDTDLKAIYAYLQTTKPVSNIVPAPISPEDVR